jgi:hypothetical protein
MRPVTATVFPGQLQAMVNMDNYATAVLGVQLVVAGGSTYVLQHSFDDPCDLISPVPVAQMRWQASLMPPGVVLGNVSVSFAIMATPLWFRLILSTGNGPVRATFLQVGEHSHSNISSGIFAPPKLADELVPGSNYGAMAK